MQSFGMTVNDQMYEQMEKGTATDAVHDRHQRARRRRRSSRSSSRGSSSPSSTRRWGRGSFKQVFAVVSHAGVISALSALFSGTVNYFRGSMGSVANLGALLPMLPEKSFAGSLLGMVDVFLDLVHRRAGHRAGRAVSPADAADRDLAAVGLRGDRHRHRALQEPGWGSMSRNKKILIGVGIVVVLGGIGYANVKFKRQDGVAVNVEAVQKRDLKAIVSASGKIQPQRLVNISADTMGRVTDLRVEEGQRVQKGEFLLQIDPRNLTTAYNQTTGVARGGALADGAAARLDREHQDVAEAGGGTARPPAAAVQGGAHAEREPRQRREPGADAPGGRDARRSGRSRPSACA